MNIVQQYTNLVDVLLALSRHFPVIPTHSPENGGCSCRKKAQCNDPGKHPRTRHGLKDATRDEAKIRELVQKYPNMNFAIPTGYQQRLLVLDFDGTLGLDSRYELERKYGPLPETVSVKTGRGEHFYYRINIPIKSRIGIFPGIDIKADGGMVVAPGSIHANGRRYEWINPPDEIPMAEAPGWLLDLIGDPKPTAAPSTEVIPKGMRNETLFKLGCSLCAKGFGKEEIFNRLREVKCSPPLSDSEIRKIAESASRYSPTKVIQLPPQSKPKPMILRWAKMPLRALYDTRLYASENYLAVLGILSSSVIKSIGYATIRQQTVCDLLNANRPDKPVCLKTVKRAYSVLKSLGYIRIHSRKSKTASGYRNETFTEIVYDEVVYEVGDTLAVHSRGQL